MPVWRIRYQGRDGRVHAVYHDSPDAPTAAQATLVIEGQGTQIPVTGASMQLAALSVRVLDIVQTDAPI